MQTHLHGPYVVIKINEGGAIQLELLDGIPFKGMVNGSQLNPYHDSRNLNTC